MKKKANRAQEISGKTFERFFTLDRANGIDEEARTVELAFSSEAEVERFFGMEVLDHSKKSVRLDRLNDGAALLVNHNGDDMVGVVESTTLGSDRVGRASVRFGNSARAEEIFNDVKDGIRKHVSVGYTVHKAVLAEERDDGPDIYRMTDWEPYEVSLVPVPADTSVGVNRSAEEVVQEAKEEARSETPIIEDRQMKDDENKVDVKKIASDARSAELVRMRAIEKIGAEFSLEDVARSMVDNGSSVQEMKDAALDHLRAKGAITEVTDTSADIGMSDKEVRSYDLMKALRAKAFPANRKFQEEAAFEMEVSDAAASAAGLASRGFMLPNEMLKRALKTDVAASAGNLVETDLRSQDFIEVLANNLSVAKLGAKMLPGLSGDIAIPKHTGSAPAAEWIGTENDPITSETLQTIVQIPMTPKTIGAFTEYSRQMFLQSSISIQDFIMGDLARLLAEGIDLAALYGTGAGGEPLGIRYQAGVNIPTAFAASPTYDDMVDMETPTYQANAGSASAAYLTSSTVRGSLKKDRLDAGSGIITWQNDEVNGYTAEVSNQVESTNKDVFFGDFTQLIMGLWGNVDILVDPYSNSKSGAVRIVAFQSVDTAVRHGQAFTWNDDAHV